MSCLNHVCSQKSGVVLAKTTRPNIPQTSQNTLAVSCVLRLHQPFALQNPPLEESQGAVEPQEISAFNGNIFNEPNNQSPDYEVCQDWYNKVQLD